MTDQRDKARCHLKYSDDDETTYWDVLSIFQVESTGEYCLAVCIWQVLADSHSILKCPHLKKGNSIQLVKLSELRCGEISPVHLIPDFSQDDNSHMYFVNRFLSEQFRNIRIAYSDDV
jgi:hypothetical protein